MGYIEEGYLKIEDVTVPSRERLSKGSVAVIECVQKIPCNPCVDSCSRGAISMGDSINNIPVINFDLCNGCGLCVSNCPGLAIFLIDITVEDNKALIGMPYEFLPLPEKDETVHLLNRAGEICGEGMVAKVRNTKVQDRTPIVFLLVNREQVMDIRFFRRKTNDQ